MTIRPATAADGPAVVALVAGAGLPVADLDPWRPGAFLVAVAGGAVAGSVAVDRAGDWGLLRSLAVDPAHRGAGLGAALVRAAVDRAAATGVAHLMLLTTTAAPFFAARGWAPLDRAALPEAVRAHPQVAGLCPSSAACLVRSLARGGGWPERAGTSPARGALKGHRLPPPP